MEEEKRISEEELKKDVAAAEARIDVYKRQRIFC